MAPEQFQDAVRHVVPATDLYGLGCLVWALLTGGPPFGRRRPILEHIKAHRDKQPPRLEAELPEAAEAWIRRLLRKDPAERFACAADAAWALRTADEPGASTLPPIPARPYGVTGSSSPGASDGTLLVKQTAGWPEARAACEWSRS